MLSCTSSTLARMRAGSVEHHLHFGGFNAVLRELLVQLFHLFLHHLGHGHEFAPLWRKMLNCSARSLRRVREVSSLRRFSTVPTERTVTRVGGAHRSQEGIADIIEALELGGGSISILELAAAGFAGRHVAAAATERVLTTWVALIW